MILACAIQPLNLIRELPIAGLKIDKSFMQNIDTNATDLNLFTSILNLANTMELSIVVKNIENTAQLNFVKSHSNQQGQGFYLERPLLPADVEKINAQLLIILEAPVGFNCFF